LKTRAAGVHRGHKGHGLTADAHGGRSSAASSACGGDGMGGIPQQTPWDFSKPNW